MSKTLTVLILALNTWGTALKSQEITLTNRTGDSLYLGIENRLEIKYPDDQIFDLRLKCTRGITRLDSGIIYIQATELGSCTLNIYANTGNDSSLIHTQTFVVVALENPRPQIYGKQGGIISAISLSKAKVEVQNTEYWLVGCDIILDVSRFRMEARRGDSILFNIQNDSARLNPENEARVRGLETGDQMRYFEIIGPNYYFEEIDLGSLEFEISNSL